MTQDRSAREMFSASTGSSAPTCWPERHYVMMTFVEPQASKNLASGGQTMNPDFRGPFPPSTRPPYGSKKDRVVWRWRIKAAGIAA